MLYVLIENQPWEFLPLGSKPIIQLENIFVVFSIAGMNIVQSCGGVSRTEGNLATPRLTTLRL